MKKLLYSILAATAILGSVSCHHDDDDPIILNPVNAGNTVTSGAWRITLYQEDDSDHTANFAGYNFTFGTDNVVSATNGTNTYTGAWSFTHDDSSSDDFNILFGSPDNFAELTEDWEVLESTALKLRLKHVSGGDGSIDYVTFEKNT